jgi:hypothetical protein
MTCFECGLPAECEHHVVPRSIGGTKTVALCEVCHGKIHGSSIGSGVLTRMALAAKRERGERLGSNPPYGYRVASDSVHLEPNESEQRAIIVARELRSVGMSLRQIGSALTKIGLLPRCGRGWHPVTVRSLLGVPR